MIELNKKTAQDFLDREWVQRLLDAGVDMSDSKYLIIKKQYIIEMKEGQKPKSVKKDYVVERRIYTELLEDVMPTYAVSELMYKLWESDRDFGELFGHLRFVKDAPFYIFYYEKKGKTTLEAPLDTPILSLAQLLILCMKNRIGCVKDISDKE